MGIHIQFSRNTLSYVFLNFLYFFPILKNEVIFLTLGLCHCRFCGTRNPGSTRLEQTTRGGN